MNEGSATDIDTSYRIHSIKRTVRPRIVVLIQGNTRFAVSLVVSQHSSTGVV